MHHSSELHSVADVLFQQVRVFGGDIMNAGIALCSEDSDEDEYWLSSDSGLRPVISIPHTEDAIQKKLYEDWKNKSEFYSTSKGGEELRAHYNYMSSVPSLKPFFQEGPDWSFPTWQKWHAAYFSHGYVFMITLEPYDEEKILVRFARVFEQAYTRFLDLQKAEAQARESQIQLAMERVRARTMAMQKSDELREAASLLFKQLEDLGVKSWSSGFNIWQADGRSATINMCNPDGSIATPYHLPHTEDIFFIKICEARQRGDDLLVMETGGKELEETYNYMFSLPEVKKVLGAMEDTGFQIPKFQVNHCAFFSQGYLMFITYEPVPEMWDVFKRFAKVFEQTYMRFNDLKQAEAQGLEAIKRASVDRVRAEIASMRTTSDLERITPLIWNELTTLGVPFTRCGVLLWMKSNNRCKLCYLHRMEKQLQHFMCLLNSIFPSLQME